MSIKDKLVQMKKESDEVINPYRDEYTDEYMKVIDQVDQWTDPTVCKEFGSFLYKALGNVNGSMKLREVKTNTSTSHWSSKKPIVGVVTNKKFGFRLQGKPNAIYMEGYDLLPGLVQSHVDLIKRDKQRVVAQDFLKFKTMYYKNWNKLVTNLPKVLAVNIPVKVAQMVNVRTSEDFNATLIDDIHEGVVESISFSLDKKTYLKEKDLEETQLYKSGCVRSKFCNGRYDTNFKLTGKVKGEEINFGSITIDFNNKKSESSINEPKNWYKSDSYSNGKDAMRILNMADVINNEKLQTTIQAFVDYNKGVAKTFEYLRLKYAKNIILQGAF